KFCGRCGKSYVRSERKRQSSASSWTVNRCNDGKRQMAEPLNTSRGCLLEFQKIADTHGGNDINFVQVEPCAECAFARSCENKCSSSTIAERSSCCSIFFEHFDRLGVHSVRSVHTHYQDISGELFNR